MALNFPANPAGQTPVNTYSPSSTPDATSNGATYIWDGAAWTGATESSGDFLSLAADAGDQNVLSTGATTFAGSASFAGGNVEIGSAAYLKVFDTTTNTTAGLCRTTGGTTYGLTIAPADDENNFTATIKADGSASFSGDVKAGPDFDNVRIRPGGLDGTSPANIYVNGVSDTADQTALQFDRWTAVNGTQ